MSGRWSSSGIRHYARTFVLVLLVLLALPYLIAPLYRVVNPVSTLMLWRWVTGQRVEQKWIPLTQVSPALPLAVIVAEDGRFCTHRGVDVAELWQAIREADDVNEARGGSTITQQVAKNLFLWQSRSFVRKVLELPLALWIDLVLPKARILEIYLNVAEWGPNGEFGAQAGAQRAFGHSAARVSVGEAALLAAMLPNPSERDARQPTPALRRVAGIHLRRMGVMARNEACLGRRPSAERG